MRSNVSCVLLLLASLVAAWQVAVAARAAPGRLRTGGRLVQGAPLPGQRVPAG